VQAPECAANQLEVCGVLVQLQQRGFEVDKNLARFFAKALLELVGLVRGIQPLPRFHSVVQQRKIGHAGLSERPANNLGTAAAQGDSNTLAAGLAIGCPKQLHSGHVEVRCGLERYGHVPAHSQCLKQKRLELGSTGNVNRALKPQKASVIHLHENCSHLPLLTATVFLGTRPSSSRFGTIRESHLIHRHQTETRKKKNEALVFAGVLGAGNQRDLPKTDHSLGQSLDQSPKAADRLPWASHPT
jgi:hypothetical protein